MFARRHERYCCRVGPETGTLMSVRELFAECADASVLSTGGRAGLPALKPLALLLSRNDGAGSALDLICNDCRAALKTPYLNRCSVSADYKSAQ